MEYDIADLYTHFFLGGFAGVFLGFFAGMFVVGRRALSAALADHMTLSD